MGSNKLLEVFAMREKFQVQAEDSPQDKPLFFESSRYKGSPGNEIGESTIVSRLEFKRHFGEFTHGFLDMVDWDNILVAGGSVLGCLRGLSPEIERPSDIDIFLYDVSDAERPDRLQALIDQLRKSLVKALIVEKRSRQEKRIQNGEEDFKERMEIDIVKTPNALTILPSLISIAPALVTSFPAVQIITRKYPTKRSIFNSFDVDCCCVGWDGHKVWAHPRAQRALVTGVNTVNLAYKNPRSYEHRLLKYARRGFAISDPGMEAKPTLLNAIVQGYGIGNPEGGVKVPVEWLVRCVKRTSGLLQIMLADEAEKRGVKWATGFESLISFDGEIEDHLDRVEEQVGNVVDDQGNLLVFSPLKDPNRHEDKLTCSIRELLQDIVAPEESEYLKFTAGILPARDAHNRKAWEMGLYEDLENDSGEVSCGQGPSVSSARAKPSVSGVSSTASSGSPTFKRRNMGGGGSRVGALLAPSPLLELPRVLVVEILQRCAGPSLAHLAATCKTLSRTVSRGMWRNLTERDFGVTSERPTGCRQPEPWNKLYGALHGLGGMTWRQWDEHPLRLECLPDRMQGEHPFPREGHATAFMGGDKLVMTGGMCTNRALEPGTYVFDLGTSKWTKQPTFIRYAPLFAGEPFPTRPGTPFVLPTRTHHTSTAVSENELLLMFGKQRATEDSDEPSLVTDIFSLDTQTWTYTRVRQEGIPPPPRRSHSACLHPSGNALLVFGGSVSTRVDLSTESENADEPGDRARVFTPGELEVMDDLHVLTRAGEQAWTWSQPVTSGKAPMARCGHSACVVGRKMVVVGGHSNVIKLPNEVYLLDLDTWRWSTLFMPTCFPPKNLTFPNTAVVVGHKLLLTRGGAETYVIDLEERVCTRLHEDMFDKKLGRRVPEFRTGHSLTRVGVSVYMVGGTMELKDPERRPVESLQILDLVGKRVV